MSLLYFLMLALYQMKNLWMMKTCKLQKFLSHYTGGSYEIHLGECLQYLTNYLLHFVNFNKIQL